MKALFKKGDPEERRVSAPSVVVLDWPLKIRREGYVLDVRACSYRYPHQVS